MNTLDFARKYLECGYSVIPLYHPLDDPAPEGKKGKRPKIAWADYQRKRPTERELEQWFGTGLANIGIVTGSLSGVNVIDCDSAEALDLAKKNGIPKCPRVKTGKGYHFYFRNTGKSNFQKKDALPGIDFRGEGGYVVAPPSVHESGLEYAWEDVDFDTPECPGWIFAEPGGKKPMAELYHGVTTGDRNQTLARMCGVWAKSLSLDVMIEMAETWNAKNESPLPHAEIITTCRSIFSKEHRTNPRVEKDNEISGEEIVAFPSLRNRLFEVYKTGLPRGESTGWKNLDEYYTVRKGEWTLVTGIPGCGKALDVSTKIPTPSGWTSMGELRVGDSVYDERGDICRVTYATPIMLNHECYCLTFDDGATIVADADHRWLTTSERARRSAIQTRKKRGTRERTKPKGTDQRHKKTFPSVVTTREIANTLLAHGKRNHHIELCGPVAGHEELPIPPYVLGAWLGDGSSHGGGITSADADVLKQIEKNGYKVSSHNCSKISHTIRGLLGGLRRYGLLRNKHIPTIYLRASVAQRIELLRGLMDTDGYCGTSGTCELTTTKAQMAHGFLELVLSLGIKASLHTGRATLNGKDCGIKYRILFTTDMRVFHLQRKVARQHVGKKNRINARVIVSCEKVSSVPVRCIQVDSPSHLYLASEHFIPTHNTEFLDHLMVNLAMNGWKFGIFSAENLPHERHGISLIEKHLIRPFNPGPTTRATEGELESAIGYLTERFFFAKPDENEVTLDRILRIGKKMIDAHGISGMVIDPWNELDHSRSTQMNETEFVSSSLTKVRRFARANNVHVWVVAHPTKLQKGKDGQYPVPTPYDVSGSAHWRNKADNALSLWRDVAQPKNPTEVHIQKIRFREVGKIGMVTMWYDVVTGRFNETITVSTEPWKYEDTANEFDFGTRQ